MNNDIEFEILPWHSAFDVGIESIDKEHKQLVYLLNKLANTLKYDKDFQTDEAFKELANYANYHFQSEEKIWEENLPDELVNLHRYNHDSFLPKILELKEKNKDKPKHLIIEEILKFLIRWLSFHIISDDKRLAILVLKLKEGKSFDEAKKIADDNIEQSLNNLTDILFSLYENLSSNTLSLMREKELLTQIELQNVEIRNYTDALNKVAIVSKTDLKGMITYVNESFCEISKYAKDELIGKTHNIIRHEDMPKSVFKELWETIQSGDTWEGTLKNKAKDGEEYFVHSTIFPLFDKDNKIKEYMGIRFLVTDETQKRREFKHKVLLSHQQLKKEIKEYQDKMLELEELKERLASENSYYIDKINKLDENNKKFKSQIDYYEEQIKDSHSISNDRLLNSKQEIKRMANQNHALLSSQKENKETINNLVKQSNEQTEEIVRLNDQLIGQNRIIQDLRDTIKHLSEEKEVNAENFFKKFLK